LDLLIVADSFREIPWLDRAFAVLTAIGAPFAMDVLCYTPEELARKADEIGIVRTALETGVQLHPA
jgi:hypothetical protein